MGNLQAPPPKFNKEDQAVLEALHKALASRSDGPTMDKRTFLQFFDYPGMFGERLFKMFDQDCTGKINRTEFLNGMKWYLNGSTEVKIRLLFDLYDLTGDHHISHLELETMLHSLARTPSLIPGGNVANSDVPLERVIQMRVETVFTECKLNEDGALSYEQFKGWIETHPETLKILDFKFNQHAWKDKDDTDKVVEGGHQGLLATKKKIMGWSKKKYVLRDRFLYAFDGKHPKPTQVIFVEGLTVGVPKADEHASKGFFGFRITALNDKHMLYALSRESRNDWVNLLRKAAHTVSVTNYFSIGKKIGKGRFATIHEGTSLKTGAKYAIKVMDKSRIDHSDQEGLRAEIAILKLVDHPRVIKMHEVFETDRYIYIILDLVRGGDLGGKLLKYGAFDQDVCQQVTIKLLQAVHHLHVRGIVHRDIKPENILVQDTEDPRCSEVLLIDFGLSRFATPKERMDVPVGTISYLAPEVVNQAGYSFKVDQWALGVLLFAMLSGCLPFGGETITDKIHSIRNDEPDLSTESWEHVTSEEAKDLIRKLLHKDPAKRISLKDALEHPWLVEPIPGPSPSTKTDTSTSSCELAVESLAIAIS